MTSSEKTWRFLWIAAVVVSAIVAVAAQLARGTYAGASRVGSGERASPAPHAVTVRYTREPSAAAYSGESPRLPARAPAVRPQAQGQEPARSAQPSLTSLPLPAGADIPSQEPARSAQPSLTAASVSQLMPSIQAREAAAPRMVVRSSASASPWPGSPWAAAQPSQPLAPAGVRDLEAAGESRAIPRMRAPYVGVLVPEKAAVVLAPQAGLIRALHVALGERVEQGQPLVSLALEQARLEHARAEAERDAAQAALGRARIEEAHAEAQAERSGALAREGLATQEELAQQQFKREEARARKAEAASQLRERSARVEQLRALRDQSEVTAAFRGRVAERYASEGSKVAAGAPLLRLVSETAIVLRFGVPEDDASVKPGDAVTLAPDAQPELGFSARVLRVSPELDAASRMRTVEAQPLDPESIVTHGLLGALVRVWAAPDLPPPASLQLLAASGLRLQP